jgi:N-acetylglucosamine-6-phosphate deacetylase
VNRQTFVNANLILPDRVLPNATFTVLDDRIGNSSGNSSDRPSSDSINLNGKYLAPGFVELHVHGGDGSDFMDLTAQAFRNVCRCHARHGTTSLTPTSTVANQAQYHQFLKLCGEFQNLETGGARVLGGHLYGPYFHPPAKGCHPNADFLKPDPAQDEELLAFAGRGLTTLTIAPETAGTQRLVEAARSRGVHVTAGHTFATFPQMEQAVGWGVRHVDHLFCAMSDRARLRPGQAYPMRAGVMEATLYFDELTTEVIADGWHLSPELLKLAYKVKGPDRLALVTDAMRAVDRPDGEYWFGAQETGELVRRLGEVGVTLDASGLASGVMGMDHCVRTFHRLTGAPIHEVIRMASLTPASILGLAGEIGSLEVGKRADFLVMNNSFVIEQVYIGGRRIV